MRDGGQRLWGAFMLQGDKMCIRDRFLVKRMKNTFLLINPPQLFTRSNLKPVWIGAVSYTHLRFREDVINLSPALVVINAGTNDVAENTNVYNEDQTFGMVMRTASR